MTPHLIGGVFFHDRLADGTKPQEDRNGCRSIEGLGLSHNRKSSIPLISRACDQLQSPIFVSKLPNRHFSRRVSRVKGIVPHKKSSVAIHLAPATALVAVAKPNFRLFRRVSIWQDDFAACSSSPIPPIGGKKSNLGRSYQLMTDKMHAPAQD